MQYGRVGDSGLVVSRLALGAMTFGRATGWASAIHKVDQRTADALVGRALDAGINCFSTADVYAEGESEQVLGRALSARRADAVVVTKGGLRSGEGPLQTGLSRRYVTAAVEASLRRLGTDWIDVYILHRLDAVTPVDESLRALDDLVRDGKVRYAGYSNWPSWKAALAVGLQRQHGWAPFRAAEMNYSLLGRELEHDVVPFAREAGIGIMAWAPLAGGYLTGRYTHGGWGAGGRLAGGQFIPFDRGRADRLVEALRMVAAAYGATPAQVALAWVMSRPQVSTVLMGASTVAQLTENLRAAELALSPWHLRALDEISSPPPYYLQPMVAGAWDAPVAKALGGG